MVSRRVCLDVSSDTERQYGNSASLPESEVQLLKEVFMLELSGDAVLSVVEVETGEEDRIVLTAKDFHQEKRSMLDEDVMRDDDGGELIADVSAFGYDFRVVAIAPAVLEIEDDPEEITIAILENNMEFVEPDDDEIED